MRKILPLISLFIVSFACADELSDAYQKEYAYLVAEKKAVQQRLATAQMQQKATLDTLRTEISILEKRFLERKNQVDRLNQQIVEASRSADTVANDGLLLETTLLQARESLGSVDISIDEALPQSEQLGQAFGLAGKVIAADSQLTTSEGEYFRQDGNRVNAPILSVGRIAKFGIESGKEGMLYPSGNGRLSLWEETTNANTALLAAGSMPSTIDVFLFDNINQAIEKRDDRGFGADVAAGGIIGKVILVLGAIGFVFVAIRILYLTMFNSNVRNIAGDVKSALQAKNREKALSMFANGKSSVHRVMAKTIASLDKDRDHIEDIVSESILQERSRIDKFGAIILVFAAVAPLLGLLGTVTGMISTFDIITEFGTGDPKLLSSGISEALITTKFGLMVAIPLLLCGNVLSSWANRIKNNLEQSALNVINTYKA